MKSFLSVRQFVSGKIIALLLIAFCSKAQNTSPYTPGIQWKAGLDTAVEKAATVFMSNPSRVGLSVGVVKDGKTYVYHFGSTEKGGNALPTDSTLYEIGSISKTFTGFLLAQAVVDKKIRLDDDVRLYLDGSYPNLSYKGETIRVVHLANHTSGLPAFLPNRPDIFQLPQDSIAQRLSDVQGKYSKELFLQDLHTVAIDTIPGFKYKYSNSATQLAGFILEKVYGKPYHELVKTYILEPLHMSYTQVCDGSYTKNLAKGYNEKGAAMPYMPPLMMAAGGIRSTISDMLKYIRFQLDEKNPSVVLSHQPIGGRQSWNGIGLYWRIDKSTGTDQNIWHTGGTFGFSSYCILYPELNTGIILLSNEFDIASQGKLVEIASRIKEVIDGK